MKLFSGYKWSDGENWGFWFRICGYGLAVSTLRPYFSQRYGYTKMLKIGRIKITMLRPDHHSQGIKQ